MTSSASSPPPNDPAIPPEAAPASPPSAATLTTTGAHRPDPVHARPALPAVRVRTACPCCA